MRTNKKPWALIMNQAAIVGVKYSPEEIVTDEIIREEHLEIIYGGEGATITIMESDSTFPYYYDVFNAHREKMLADKDEPTEAVGPVS